MFGFGEKAKVAAAIQAGMTEILSGAHATPDQCAALCQTEQGASWLFTEAMVQFTNMLAWMAGTRGSGKSWFTVEFFSENAIKAAGPRQLDLVAVLLKGHVRLQSVGGQGPERIRLMFMDSARLVHEQDPTTDQEAIAAFLEKRAEGFMNSVGGRLFS